MSESKYVPPSMRDPLKQLQPMSAMPLLNKQLPAINASSKTVAAAAAIESTPVKYVPPSLRSQLQQQQSQSDQTFDEMFPVAGFATAPVASTKKFSYANLFSKKVQEEIDLKIEELEDSQRIVIVDTSSEPYEAEPTQWSSLGARRLWWLARERALKVCKHNGRGPLFEIGDSGVDDVELVSHPSEEYTEVSSQGEYSEEISVEGYDTD